ncbi:MAG TPA: hypothetical protein VFA74_01675 [Terriglobales bacterium]|nr:hypothetical protein [Terriglobales bacterium]
MRTARYPALKIIIGSMLFTFWIGIAFSAGSEKKISSFQHIRWDANNPGCTFNRGEDGKYRYGISQNDIKVMIAVDAQEIAKVRRRVLPLFGVLLTVDYLGKNSLDVQTKDINLEFVKHAQVVHYLVDPDRLTEHLQDNSDALDNQTRHTVRHEPGKKQEQEAMLQAHLKDIADMMEFLGTQALRGTTLDPGKPEASGWIFFSTKDKFIGGWKTPEEFVLRVPVGDRLFEFPFKLPPQPGDLILRRRAD